MFQCRQYEEQQEVNRCFLNTVCWRANNVEVWMRLTESGKTAWNECLSDDFRWLKLSVGTLQLCRSLTNSVTLFLGLWAQRPQQNWLSIFSYSIVAFLDLKSQMSRENTCLRNLNKLQITAFEGKCPVLVSWNHIGFR